MIKRCCVGRRWSVNRVSLFWLIALSYFALHDLSWAQTNARAPTVSVRSPLSGRINSNTLTIVSGSPSGTYLPIAYDLATVLDDSERLRLLVLLGKGGWQNVGDVRYLRGVDLGLVQTNVLNHLSRSKELGTVEDSIVYIAKLYNEEMHILARSNIASIGDLRGKRVNFNIVGSGTQFTARELFSRLDIAVKEVNLATNDAIEKLKSGDVEAVLLSSGKPAPAIAALRPSDGFHLVAVPFGRKFIDDYLPVELTHDDYPALVPEGKTVETVGVGTALVAYNWPKTSERYKTLEKFVTAFFEKVPEFKQPPRHPKWKETYIGTKVAGFRRFSPAEQYVNDSRDEVMLATRSRFETFLAERGQPALRGQDMSENDRNQLFREFMRWNGARAATQAQ